MSFQLENPYTQPQNKPSLCNSDFLLRDHHHQDDVLISKIFPITLNLFDTSIKQSPSSLKFQEPCSIFARNTTFLNSKSKQKRSLEQEDHTSEETMSRRNCNNNNMPKLDLKLNLSPPSSRLRVNSNQNTRMESPTRSPSVSPPSSCVSSDFSMSSSPESSPMVLVGCPRCLMYVMLSEDDPKCPKCKSTVLLDFVHESHSNNNINNNYNVSGGSKKTRKG